MTDFDDEPRTSRIAWLGQRWRALCALALAVALAAVAVDSSLYWPGRVFPGFFVLANRLVPVVGLYGWTGRAAGVPPLSRVVEVDGRPVATAADVYAAAAAGGPRSVRYTFERDADTTTIDVPTMRFRGIDWWLTCGLFIANGLLTIGAGIVVAFLQPGTEASKGFLAFSFLSGLIMLSAPPIYDPRWQWFTPVNLVAHAFWGAGFLHLGLVFPVVRPLIVRRRSWLLAPYVASAAIAAWACHAFTLEPPDMRPIYVSFVYVGVSMLALAGLFVSLYRGDPAPITRVRLGIIVPGFVLSCALACFGFLENAFVGRFPINLAVLLPVFFYLAVAYAIVRHDLFDIDRIVRQAAVYTTLTLAVTLGYALVLVLVSSSRFGDSTAVFSGVFAVLVAILFEPLRLRVQRLIDRTFFRARVNYRRTVGEVSAALSTMLDLGQIIGRVSTALESGLSPASFGVVLWLHDEARLWTRGPDGLVAVEAATTSALREQLQGSPNRSWRVPPPGTAPDARRVAAAEAAALGATLVVPLVLGDQLLGAFVLGEKRSGLPYGSADRELLETLAAQSAVAIENARLFGEVTELNRELEGKVQRRTAELESSNGELRRAYSDLQHAQAQLLQSEKMASLGQLTAGLAHEINTPVTAVIGNMKPLWNEIARLRDRAGLHGDATLEASVTRIRSIAEVMARGAERTASIVQDLRVFSRVEETKPLPMDLHESIEVSLRLLRPRWADRIETHRDYGEIPLVEASASQVNQVLMNLLANACDAIEERGHIWIETRADASRVTITVRDDGGGIADEVLGRVFDPFFTTKPVGKGMGLGLAISASIVRDHGGSLEVASANGRGASFVLVLPIRGVARMADGSRTTAR